MFKKELIMQENTVVKCNSMEEINLLCDWAEKELGQEWTMRNRDIEYSCYNIFKNTHCSHEALLYLNYKFLTFSQVLLPQLVKIEVGVNKEYKNGNYKLWWENKFDFEDSGKLSSIKISRIDKISYSNVTYIGARNLSLEKVNEVMQVFGFELDLESYYESKKVKEISMNDAMKIVANSLGTDIDKLKIVGGE